jgi:Immunity protein 22
MAKTETLHFWVGSIPEPVASTYFKEVYDENGEDREQTPLSAFAGDQGETWYDHDCLEMGFRTGDQPFAVWFRPHSYSEQWGEELLRRLSAVDLGPIDWFAFIEESQIAAPRSVEGDGYWLRYLGTITVAI